MDPGKDIEGRSPPLKNTLHEQRYGTQAPSSKMAFPKSNLSGVSIRSDASMGHPMNLKSEPPSCYGSLQNLQSPEGSSCASYKSDGLGLSLKDKFSSLNRSQQQLHSPEYSRSPEMQLSPEYIPSYMENEENPRNPRNPSPRKFHYRSPSFHRSPQPLLSPGSEHSPVSLRIDGSAGSPFKDERPSFVRSAECLSFDDSSRQQTPTSLDSIFKLLEDKIMIFVKDELKKAYKVLRADLPQWSESSKDVDDMQRQSSDALLKITLNFLRQLKYNDLADVLQIRSSAPVFQHNLKCNLQQKFQCVFEGIAKAGKATFLNQIYTELYISEGETTEVKEEHEVRHMETATMKPDEPETTILCKDIFKGPSEEAGRVRTVLTKGVAGIGKTVLTQKFSLDWAEGTSNQDIHFVFPFTFRELNLLKDKTFSLVELIHHFFSETKEVEVSSFQDMQVVFIFDGLDECRLPLDFQQAKTICSVTESTSVDLLLTNLIRGSLFPSAFLWITTRPAAANQIPAQCVSIVTEVRGFTNPQKEEYFRKRFPEEKAVAVISHVKSSRSLYIMCHIPIFCWIAATILQNVMEGGPVEQLPKTLTEMYIHFLVVQAKVKNVKYDRRSETDQHWSPESKKMIESLGKLAFEQLQKGNLIFYESDLIECGIDITTASVYSGVFTEMFREESGLYQNKVFCFVHLSVQEFLAALHVHITFFNSGVNLLSETQTPEKAESAEAHLYQTAIDKALQSHNGHLDMFLRFLLGLSLDNNQVLLQGLLPKVGGSSRTNKETVDFIRKKISQYETFERYINLFHCLTELNDRGLLNQIQWSLNSGQLRVKELSAAQWSALVFILLSSEKELFDLKEYCPSEQGLVKLLPVVKVSKTALLSGCSLSNRSCAVLSSALSSKSCNLKELDLSNNNLSDLGMKELASGLKSPNCKLETLRLSGCLITAKGCTTLASALKCNPSHLKVLDLSYNHPGDEGIKDLFALRMAPESKLETLRLDPAGVHWLIPDLMKYFFKITFDNNTVNKCLQLFDNNKKVAYALKNLSYPDHPDRFDYWHQVLCSTPLTSCCYQEVEWTGVVEIAMTYKRIKRKGHDEESRFGGNNHSWRLRASTKQCYMCHNKARVPIKQISSNRIGVFVDHAAGTLSFFSVSDHRRVHLCTINTTFTEPLYMGIALMIVPPPLVPSATLCDLSEELSNISVSTV